MTSQQVEDGIDSPGPLLGSSTTSPALEPGFGRGFRFDFGFRFGFGFGSGAVTVVVLVEAVDVVRGEDVVLEPPQPAIV